MSDPEIANTLPTLTDTLTLVVTSTPATIAALITTAVAALSSKSEPTGRNVVAVALTPASDITFTGSMWAVTRTFEAGLTYNVHGENAALHSLSCTGADVNVEAWIGYV